MAETRLSMFANSRLLLIGILAIARMPMQCNAAEDDLVVTDPPPATQRMLGQIRVVRQIQPAVIQAPGLVPRQFPGKVNITEIDLLVFGGEPTVARRAIDDQVDRAVHTFALKYDLSVEQMDKLALSALGEKISFLKQVDELKTQFNQPNSDLNGVRNKAIKLRQTQVDLMHGRFGNNSFFAKTSQKILSGELIPSDVNVNEYLSNLDALQRSEVAEKKRSRIIDRHFANIEGAIRGVERRVILRKSQHDALFRLLSKETRPPACFGDFDDIVVKYRLSLLPREKLRPIFDDMQWPEVVQALDGFREFGPVLKHHNLAHSEAAPETPASAPVIDRQETAIAVKGPNGEPAATIYSFKTKVRDADWAGRRNPNGLPVTRLMNDPSLLQSRHRANIDAAIRIIERHTSLQDSQRRALEELLLKEIPSPKSVGNFDDLIVRYRIFQLPETKLKPLFDDDQWPKVRFALNSVQLFNHVLVDNGLVDIIPVKVNQ